MQSRTDVCLPTSDKRVLRLHTAVDRPVPVFLGEQDVTDLGLLPLLEIGEDRFSNHSGIDYEASARLQRACKR